MAKTIPDLYKLFFSKGLINVTKIPVPEPGTPPKKRKINELDPVSRIILSFSPMASSIYNSTSPDSKPYILKDLLTDTAKINDAELRADMLDPDFQEKLENNGLGFFMENFISVYGNCPVCGKQTLRKFAHSNVPVIDLVCINTDYHLENNKCFIFQVKMSMTNNYFNLSNQSISVGSDVYGKPSHLHKGIDDITHKIIVPGYICIKLIPHPTEIQSYTVNHQNSFVLVPDYQNTSDKYFYKYLTKPNRYGKSMITWDTSMVKTMELKNILGTSKVNYEFFMEDELKNPYINLMSII